jgi:nucleotide-binding universal stress UspA family protein
MGLLLAKALLIGLLIAAAGALKADLVVMATAGHHGFLDALRGSTTERVLRKLTCPLLAVPVPKPEPA